MISRFRDATLHYPRQFWVLFFGQLVSSSGSSLVWPFMTIYVHERLGVPLTVVGLVLAANSGAGLISQVVAGPLIDRFGRKMVMLASLAAAGMEMTGLGLANSLPSFAALLMFGGFFGYIFNPALNAMLADIIEPKRRIEAYGLIRIVANLGVAIGPAIGGFIASRSYFVSFMCAAAASTLYFFIILLFVRETKPEVDVADIGTEAGDEGYGRLLRDHSFLFFCITFTLMAIAYAQMMTIFPVYIKDQYEIPESQFGLIMATNAAMVVLFQYPIAHFLERFRLGPVLAWGALFVGLGVGMVALSSSFPVFLLSMIVVTIGELIFAPSSTAFVAQVAPEMMRGRYMGVYGMTFGLAFGLGPVVGGAINDNLGPVFVWQIMAGIALLSAAAFMLIGRKAMGDRPLAVGSEPATDAAPSTHTQATATITEISDDC